MIVDDFKDIAARLDQLHKPADPMKRLADALASMPDITATQVFDHIDWGKAQQQAQSHGLTFMSEAELHDAAARRFDQYGIAPNKPLIDYLKAKNERIIQLAYERMNTILVREPIWAWLDSDQQAELLYVRTEQY